MRERDDTGRVEQLAAREVADIGAELTGFQGLNHRLLVHDLVAREVQQHGALLHEVQARRIDDATGVIIQRHMERDHIRLGDQIVDADGALGHRRELPGAFHGQFRIVAYDLHAQIHGGIGHLDADRPQAQHRQFLAGQFEAGKLLLAFLDLGMHGLVVAFQSTGIG